MAFWIFDRIVIVINGKPVIAGVPVEIETDLEYNENVFDL
jgi:hypothetical protein